VNTVTDTLVNELAAGDLLLTMGAGSVDLVARAVFASLEVTSHA
jgi:UDP-N-acetylmuramate-alanine ligase